MSSTEFHFFPLIPLLSKWRCEAAMKPDFVGAGLIVTETAELVSFVAF